jgi:hypothetical protein
MEADDLDFDDEGVPNAWVVKSTGQNQVGLAPVASHFATCDEPLLLVQRLTWATTMRPLVES